MRIKQHLRKATPLVAVTIFVTACILFAAEPAMISIPSKNLFPESITSIKNGTIIIGSWGTNSIWRVPAGTTTATKWIDVSGMGPLLGLLADEKSGRLLVCKAGVKTFDLKTGAPKEVLTI